MQILWIVSAIATSYVAFSIIIRLIRGYRNPLKSIAFFWISMLLGIFLYLPYQLQGIPDIPNWLVMIIFLLVGINFVLSFSGMYQVPNPIKIKSD